MHPSLKMFASCSWGEQSRTRQGALRQFACRCWNSSQGIALSEQNLVRVETRNCDRAPAAFQNDGRCCTRGRYWDCLLRLFRRKIGQNSEVLACCEVRQLCWPFSPTCWNHCYCQNLKVLGNSRCCLIHVPWLLCIHSGASGSSSPGKTNLN